MPFGEVDLLQLPLMILYSLFLLQYFCACYVRASLIFPVVIVILIVLIYSSRKMKNEGVV